MYVKIGRPEMTERATITEDRRGEPILTLRKGSVNDDDMARELSELVAQLTTYEALKKRLFDKPFSYGAAARILGVSVRWLQRKVATDPTFPHRKIGTHVVFDGCHIEEILERFDRGELRYSRRGGRPAKTTKGSRRRVMPDDGRTEP